jgi:hypothetical protein
VVEKAKVRFNSRPLGVFLESGATQQPRTRTITPLEKNVNTLLKLSKTLKWPRSATGKILPPTSWRPAAIGRATKNEKQAAKFRRLRTLSNVMVDAVIEVPERAFFFIVVEERTRLKKNVLLAQYESGQVLYQLLGYNRCRLFTLTRKEEPKRIQQIDTALTWTQLYHVFDENKARYAPASRILETCHFSQPGGAPWKSITDFPSGTC